MTRPYTRARRDRKVAVDFSILGAGPGRVSIVFGAVRWKVKAHSVLIQRWKQGKTYKTAIIRPSAKLRPGRLVLVFRGKVQK